MRSILQIKQISLGLQFEVTLIISSFKTKRNLL